MDADFIADLEASIARLATALTDPRSAECVLCYVLRMLEEFGCDGRLRWTAAWRDRRVPAASALERRMQAKGGFCDCEIFMNGYATSQPIDDDPRVGLPPCCGVSARSSQPCTLWYPRYRRYR